MEKQPSMIFDFEDVWGDEVDEPTPRHVQWALDHNKKKHNKPTKKLETTMSHEINDDILARIPPGQLLEELHRRQDQVKKDSAEAEISQLSGPQPPAAQPDEATAAPDRWSWIGNDRKPYSVRVRGEAVYLLQPERQYEKIFAIFTTDQFQAILGGLGDYGPYRFTLVHRGLEVQFTRAVARSRTTSEFLIPIGTLAQVQKFFL